MDAAVTGDGDGSATAYDVVVVGGGAAGLSGALALARARRSVLVIDSGTPRNAPASSMHNYLGLDGTPPLDLLVRGRREVTRYGGEVVDDEVTEARRLDAGGFVVARRYGPTVQARRLLVTSGLADELPDVPGLASTGARRCCTARTATDRRCGTVRSGCWPPPRWASTRPCCGASGARRSRSWSTPGDDEAAQLAARSIELVAGPAVAVEAADGHVAGVRLADGGLMPCQAVVVMPRFSARARFLDDLGLAGLEFRTGDVVLGSHVPADAMGATAVPGVWVAGNVANPMDGVINAAAAGLRAAQAINLDLIADDTRAALRQVPA